MCNYMAVFSLHSCSRNWGESFVLSSCRLLSRLAVEFYGDDDDNRGSGR